jgi:hypothetical protein
MIERLNSVHTTVDAKIHPDNLLLTTRWSPIESSLPSLASSASACPFSLKVGAARKTALQQAARANVIAKVGM